MNRRRAGAIFLSVATLLAALLAVRFAGRAEVPAGSVDPAIAFHTGAHSPHYGGIDRWAYHGMRAESVAELLAKDGYACTPPPASAGGKLTGIHEMVCSKALRWPMARALSIRAGIDYDMRGRLVAASASSDLFDDGQPIGKPIASVLRSWGWIEPEKLQVKGFEIDSTDMLARLAADALAGGGWHGRCASNPSVGECVALARERRKSGLPALPQPGIAVGAASTLEPALERVRLLPTVPRGADARPADSLLVRLAEGQMWMDFAGRDLTGREFMVSIAIDSEGGAPVQLVAKLLAESRVVALGGERRKANDGAMMYLVPEAGAHDPRAAVWLDLPNKNFPGTFRNLASRLPSADPAFIPRIVKAVIAGISVAERPEESLGLYPALRSIELRADTLRAARADLWLPGEQGNLFIKQAYRDEPATRAAWAMALCEPATRPPVADANCWQRMVIADPDAAAVLRSAVAELQAAYAVLEPEHPLRVRLKRLGDTLRED